MYNVYISGDYSSVSSTYWWLLEKVFVMSCRKHLITISDTCSILSITFRVCVHILP